MYFFGNPDPIIRMKTLQTKVRRLQNKYDQLLQENSLLLAQAPDFNDFSTLCDKYLDPTLAEIAKISASSTKPRGRQYSDQIKKVAQDLYSTSPECYDKILKFLLSPSTSTLDNEKRKLRLTPGVNSMFMDGFKMSLEGSITLQSIWV